MRICILRCTLTAPPLPASPCLRVRLDYGQSDTFKGGNRLYFAYAGSAPTAGNCATLASDIAAAWATNIAPLVHTSWGLNEVDVLDIASDVGASGQWTGVDDGSYSGSELPASAATNVEFGIARRYRGGKPRIFLPPPGQAAMLDAAHWTTTFVGDVSTAVDAFFAEVVALSVGAVGTLSHVNLSYYKGFTNVTNSSGRTRAVPTYRASALLDPVESYIVKGEISSQRRRRIALTY